MEPAEKSRLITQKVEIHSTLAACDAMTFGRTPNIWVFSALDAAVQTLAASFIQTIALPGPNYLIEGEVGMKESLFG